MTSIDTTLSWRRTDRTINGADLDPQRVAVLRIGGNWLHKFVMNDAQGNFTVNGVAMFGANHDEHGIARAAHSQFHQARCDSDGYVAAAETEWGGVVWGALAASTRIRRCWFGATLSWRQRGFRSGEIAGDRGLYSRNEFA
nr:ShlB/FhaC/HecB family hemolysin secretion/activation protein [Burkholderia stabilis]